MEVLKLLTFSKTAILSLFESNASGSKVHSTKISCMSEFEVVNKALYEWHLLACSMKIFLGGSQPIGKAKLSDWNISVHRFGWESVKQDNIK